MGLAKRDTADWMMLCKPDEILAAHVMNPARRTRTLTFSRSVSGPCGIIRAEIIAHPMAFHPDSWKHPAQSPVMHRVMAKMGYRSLEKYV